MNYTYEEINMFISRDRRGSQDSSKSHHKDPTPLLTQFTNWQFRDEVRTRITNLTSKKNVYVSQTYSKELAKRRNEALKYMKE